MYKDDKEFLVQKIRTQYTEKEHTQLDELKALDKKVKRPAAVFAYVLGSISAIIMGSGMSLIMTDIGTAIGIFPVLCIVIGILFGIPCMALIAFAYLIYNFVLRIEKEKAEPETLKLAAELEGKNNT
jgi:hypothetical protein